MLTTTIRRMLAHKLRLVLTTASIALGVAFLAGTLILTDTMGLAFKQLFGKVSAGTDAVVRTEAAVHRVRRRRHQPRPDRRLGPRRAVKDVDGVRVAEGIGERLRAAHRQRRQGHPHQRRRADPGLQHAGRREAAR